MTSGSLTDSLRETLALFDESGVPRTTTEVADVLDLGRRSTYDRLERLVDAGRLETKKVGANARVWWRAPTLADRSDLDWSATAVSLVDDVLDTHDVAVKEFSEQDANWVLRVAAGRVWRGRLSVARRGTTDVPSAPSESPEEGVRLATLEPGSGLIDSSERGISAGPGPVVARFDSGRHR